MSTAQTATDRGKSGKVARILSLTTLAINRGSQDGVRQGDRYVIYVWGDEVSDPDTGENLGKVQIVKGRGEVISVQDKLSVLETFRIESEGGFSVVFSVPTKKVEPIKGIEVGDFVWRTNR